jgi:hypothetical protein
MFVTVTTRAAYPLYKYWNSPALIVRSPVQMHTVAAQEEGGGHETDHNS